jgi:5'-3' exonuclease
MIERGATHIGVATDHVVESFRNDLYAGYKTSEGVPAPLLTQFPILEEALEAMGVVVWPMVYYEADDALASAAAKAARDHRVRQVIICTPDKDLAQCVVGTRVVQLDRRRNLLRDEAGVAAKFGVKPQSIPDYLAVLGDTADGFPGVPGWDEKAAALTLTRYSHLENIPKDWRDWHPSISNARRLATSLFDSWNDALLFRTLATLRLDAAVFSSVDDLRWKGLPQSLKDTAAPWDHPICSAAQCRQTQPAPRVTWGRLSNKATPIRTCRIRAIWNNLLTPYQPGQELRTRTARKN